MPQNFEFYTMVPCNNPDLSDGHIPVITLDGMAAYHGRLSKNLHIMECGSTAMAFEISCTCRMRPRSILWGMAGR